MSRFYVCGIEQTLLKEKNFTSRDLQPGQLVNVTVEAVKTEGLVVTCGHVRGFVPNQYISNVEYSDNLKRKFKEGLKAKARFVFL